MTKDIVCPYCNAQMAYRELGHGKAQRHCFYECSKCLSRSPLTFNEVTANSMATMRQKRTKMPVK